MKLEGGGLCLVLKFCLVLGSDHNHNRWKREGEEYVFPVPKIENVYQAWKPIDYGHPLVDPTMHYIPPELETVHIGPQKPEQFDPFGEGAVTDQFLNAKVYPSPETGRSNDPDRVHVYKAHSSHRVVKAEPGNIIPDHTKASPRIDIEEFREASAPQPLKSGIYYVDDPFAEFRPKKRRRDPTADRFRFPGDKGFGRRVDIEREERRKDDYSEGMYIPVSLLSTPPTIETTDRSYGDIVNEDFYQFELKNKNPQVYPAGPELPPAPAQGSVFPLGNPYGAPDYRRTPNRGLQGVFGPRIPEVSDHPAPRLDTRQGEPNVWTPRSASYVAKDREFSGQLTVNRQKQGLFLRERDQQKRNQE